MNHDAAVERNAKIKKIARLQVNGYPRYPQVYIAALFGMTRQRVQQIIGCRRYIHQWFP